MFCAGRANRVYDGVEDDHYVCEECSGKFGINWEARGPAEKPCWPPSDEELETFRALRDKNAPLSDRVADKWQKQIIGHCELLLGRPLRPEEQRFVSSRGGRSLAPESIADRVKALSGSPADLERYLNSASDPRR